MKKLLVLLITLFAFIPLVSAAEKAEVHVFYRESCPHCKDLHEYLDKLSEDPTYKNMFEVKYYEVSTDKKNIELFGKTINYFGLQSTGVPFYVVGEAYNIGFPNPNSNDEYMKKELEARDTELKKMINASFDNGEKNIVKLIQEGSIEPTTTKRTTKDTTTLEVNNNNDIIQESKKEVNFKYTYAVIPGVLIAIVLLIILFRKKNKNEKTN